MSIRKDSQEWSYLPNGGDLTQASLRKFGYFYKLYNIKTIAIFIFLWMDLSGLTWSSLILWYNVGWKRGDQKYLTKQTALLNPVGIQINKRYGRNVPLYIKNVKNISW